MSWPSIEHARSLSLVLQCMAKFNWDKLSTMHKDPVSGRVQITWFGYSCEPGKAESWYAIAQVDEDGATSWTMQPSGFEPTVVKTEPYPDCILSALQLIRHFIETQQSHL